MSLSDYLISEIRSAAEHPTPDELCARLQQRMAVDPSVSAPRAVRAERDRA